MPRFLSAKSVIFAQLHVGTKRSGLLHLCKITGWARKNVSACTMSVKYSLFGSHVERRLSFGIHARLMVVSVHRSVFDGKTQVSSVD